MLLQEKTNTEIPLRPGSEYVPYDSENLETAIEYYLTHDEERQAVVAAARSRLPEFSFPALWTRVLQDIRHEGARLVESSKRRLGECQPHDLMTALWSTVSGSRVQNRIEALKPSSDEALAAIAAGLVADAPRSRQIVSSVLSI